MATDHKRPPSGRAKPKAPEPPPKEDPTARAPVRWLESTDEEPWHADFDLGPDDDLEADDDLFEPDTEGEGDGDEERDFDDEDGDADVDEDEERDEDEAPPEDEEEGPPKRRGRKPARKADEDDAIAGDDVDTEDLAGGDEDDEGAGDDDEGGDDEGGGKRRGRRRSKTIARKQMLRERRRMLAEGTIPEIVEYDRPKTREDCRPLPPPPGVDAVVHATQSPPSLSQPPTARPCLYVSCRYHLYLDVNPVTGSIKLNFPDKEVWQLAETCALDVAERGGITLEEVGEIMNLTRERIRQVEVSGLVKLKRGDATLHTFVDGHELDFETEGEGEGEADLDSDEAGDLGGEDDLEV